MFSQNEFANLKWSDSIVQIRRQSVQIVQSDNEMGSHCQRDIAWIFRTVVCWILHDLCIFCWHHEFDHFSIFTGKSSTHFPSIIQFKLLHIWFLILSLVCRKCLLPIVLCVVFNIFVLRSKHRPNWRTRRWVSFHDSVLNVLFTLLKDFLQCQWQYYRNHYWSELKKCEICSFCCCCCWCLLRHFSHGFVNVQQTNDVFFFCVSLWYFCVIYVWMVA